MKPWPDDVVALLRQQEGLITRRQLGGAGVNDRRISRALADGRLRRAARGVFDTITVPVEARRHDLAGGGDVHAHRRRRAAWLGLLTHGSDVVAVGQTALVLHGVQGLPPQVTVEVARRDRRERRAQDGVVLRRYTSPRGFHLRGGRLVVPIETALAQAVPELDRRTALAVLDSALHQRLITVAGLERAHALARGRRGVARTHDWWRQADGRAESPAESWARADCIDAGVAPDVLQLELVDGAGRVVARCDLAWHLGGGRWLLVEVDGAAVHSTAEALYRDRARQNPLVAAGHVVLRFTGADAWSGAVSRAVRPVLRGQDWGPGRPAARGRVSL
ncbi:type IV toxin-antitoxin system AbiEi family antitoxin domain-containing protein [Puerhibacterium puerhi]|uniref:type IV toxin-antitoxin system AbiEi family antitoxin domain-containing protein n=1 Tax=Puerhibacterium puerhi TaxID=2692623 RepID=UPI00135712B2|nr:type IV toxin-antitoxin system AbiEi family antitoxin domain-containing protein [Puerhibacterium puerhi]